MTRKHLLVNVTWRCQNAGICSYCWVNQTVRTRPELMDAPERSYDDWLGAIKRNLSDNDVVDIAGGEPFLVDWVIDLIQACPNIWFGLSTNGLKPSAIEKLSAMRPGNVAGLNVSYHPEGRKKYGNYDELWQRSVEAIKRHGGHVGPNIVNAPGIVEQAADAIEWMKKRGVKAVVSPYEHMDTLGETQPLGLCCQGGVSHLTIAPDGSAWPCLTTLRSPYWKETCLGNWIDGTIDISKKPNPCHLQCVDYFVLPHEHSAGDLWQLCVKPCEGEGA